MKRVIEIPLTLRVEYEYSYEDYKYLEPGDIQIIDPSNNAGLAQLVTDLDDFVYNKDFWEQLKDYVYERHFNG